MTSESASLFSWSYGLSAMGYGLFSLYLFRLGAAWRKGGRATAMLLAVTMSFVWAAFGCLFGLMAQPRLLSATVLFDLLRYGSWYLFLLLLITPAGDQKRKHRILALQAGAWVILGAGLFVQVNHFFALTLLKDAAHGALFQSLAMILYAVVLLEQFFRNVALDSRWNVKPLCLGLFAAFAFDLYVYSNALMFSQMDADAFGIRGMVHALVIPLLLLGTMRSRDWTSKVRVSQKLAFHSATLLIAGVYLLFMAALGYYVRYFGGSWGGALQLALMFGATLFLGVLAFSGAIRAKLRVLLGKHFFSYRYDYREEWLRFTQTLSTQSAPIPMGQQIVRGLGEMLESPAGALWVRDLNRQTLVQFARWNSPLLSTEEPMDSSLCRFLLDSGWVINLEEYRSSSRRYGDLQLPEWFAELPKAWLIVPLMVGNEMIGFVVLDRARTRIDVNWEINDLLRTAGRQAASFLAQMQATEALLEARKFDAFNRMSAFVVHDLKNIVTQLSLMLRNAERHSDNPEFQRDMVRTVEHSVERMRQLMLQLREGATPPGTACGVDLAKLIERIKKAKEGQGRTVEVSIGDKISTRGHEERIERVIGHLIQNSLDATDRGGRVWAKLDRQGGLAQLEIGDTGHGMSEEFLRDRLFKPFQTTKQAGMGIGAYESFQYVQELGGKVTVHSELNVGTTIRVLLPLFDGGSSSGVSVGAAIS